MAKATAKAAPAVPKPVPGPQTTPKKAAVSRKIQKAQAPTPAKPAAASARKALPATSPGKEFGVSVLTGSAGPQRIVSKNTTRRTANYVKKAANAARVAATKTAKPVQKKPAAKPAAAAPAPAPAQPAPAKAAAAPKAPRTTKARVAKKIATNKAPAARPKPQNRPAAPKSASKQQ